MTLDRIAELEAKNDILRDENRQLRKRLLAYESRDASLLPPPGDPIYELDLCLMPQFRSSFDGQWLSIDDVLPLTAQGD